MTADARIEKRNLTSAQIEERRARKQRRRHAIASMQAPILSDPATLLHIATVSAIVGLGSTAIYDRIRAGTFPEPKRLSARCSRWRAEEVRAWLESQMS